MGCDRVRRLRFQTRQRGRLSRRCPEHGIGKHVRFVTVFHAPIVVAGATREFVHQEEAFQHGFHIPIAHQRPGNPDLMVQRHIVPVGEGFDLFGNAVVFAEVRQVDPFAVSGPESHGEDETGAAFLRQDVRFTVCPVQTGGIEERRDFEDFDAHSTDDGPGIFVQNAPGASGKLDAVPVHHKRDGRAVNVGGVKTVERLARDPAGVSAMGNHPASIAEGASLTQRVAHRNGNHHTQTAAVHLRAPRQPGNVAGKIHAATKVGNDVFGVDKSQRGKRGIISDAGMGVFDGILDAFKVDHRQGEQQ